MTSPRIRGRKVGITSSSKIKKDADGIKGDYEKTNDVESTLKMMLRQAHEIHKGFYKRTQGLRKSQSVETLKNETQEELPVISDGKGDVCHIKENISDKKKLKDPVKLGKIVRAPLRPKMTNKKIRKNPSKDTKIEIRKPTSASSLVGRTSGKKPASDSDKSVVGKFNSAVKKVEETSLKSAKVLCEKEVKREDGISGKKSSEKRVLSPEEIISNIHKSRNEESEKFSKTDTKFIDVLLSIGQKVLKRDFAKGEGNESLGKSSQKTLKNFPPSESSTTLETFREILGVNKDHEYFTSCKGDPDKEMKSYRELKSFVNDELLRIWKPYEKVEVKNEKELEKPEADELKPGRIIVKPNPTSYLEKRALSPKTNCTSLIRKLDQEKKRITEDVKAKDSKIVKRLENAFETLNRIDWEKQGGKKVARVKEEDLTKSILRRIDDHKKAIVGEISKTEKKIHEKFDQGRRKVKRLDKSLEIHFKRSLHEVQSTNGLLVETEKECKEITRQIFDEYRSKKIGNTIQEKSFPNKVQKFDVIDRKIQKDFKKLGLINFKKPDRIKLQNKGAEKVAECSGWRKKKSQPSRSISRSIGSTGGTENQGLPPISLQNEPIIPGKMAADVKPVDDSSTFDQRKILDAVDKAEDTQDFFGQASDVDNESWDDSLEDPGGSSSVQKKAEPMFVNLEELRYRKGDPSFRYFGLKEEDLQKKPPTPELEALRRERELQRILALDKDFAADEKTAKKQSNAGKGTNARVSIIVDHITSGERMDDNEKVLGHASKLVVKEDKEIREKKFSHGYYKQGMRRVTEPAIPQSQFSDVNVLKRSNRKSEPVNIRRTESKDAECQTDTTDTSDDDLDLYSFDDESIN